MRSEAVVGMAIMTPLSLAAGYARLKDQSLTAIEDRAYRIKHNEGQQQVDQFSFYAAAAGGFVGAIGFGVNPILGFAQGGALGVGLGVIAYEAYKHASQLQ